MKWAKKASNYSTYVTHKKSETQKTFCHCRLKDLPSLLRAWSSLAQSVEELRTWNDTCKQINFKWTARFRPAFKVLKSNFKGLYIYTYIKTHSHVITVFHFRKIPKFKLLSNFAKETTKYFIVYSLQVHMCCLKDQSSASLRWTLTFCKSCWPSALFLPYSCLHELMM